MATPSKKEKRQRRQVRIRAKVSGTPERPRLAVFRSNTALSAQLIDDTKGHTIVAGSTRGMKGTPMEKATALGEQFAKTASEKKVKSVVFDRGGFSFAGNIKAFADGARKGGLQF